METLNSNKHIPATKPSYTNVLIERMEYTFATKLNRQEERYFPLASLVLLSGR